MLPLIYLRVKILKILGVERDGAEPTDMLQRPLLPYEEKFVGGRICTLKNL
jgi:hypothetical protein